MNFFEQQENALKQTKRLIFLFGAAVMGLSISIWAVLLVALGSSREADLAPTSEESVYLLAVVMLVTCVTIGLGSLFKVMQLKSGGGHSVAQALNGHLVDPSTQDSQERRLLNVVEEMSIASGIPVPTVYILEEEGINAFAAGFRIEEAVIGVTRGCIERLSRDQLQGVIAHEFSHILNGDMALNIKLMGILFGILMISIFGRILISSSRYPRSRKSNSGGNIIFFGFILMILGWIGLFFAKLIKTAISRQREFLADASAVQFTRNPEGIGEALQVIGAHKQGSSIVEPRVEESSHMFFGSVESSLSGLFSTHPTLEERIHRILPHWDGTFAPPTTAKKIEKKRKAPSTDQETTANINTLLGDVGRITVLQLAFASTLIKSTPDKIREALRNGFGARAFCYGILINKDPEVRAFQLRELCNKAERSVVQELHTLLPLIKSLKREYLLPLVKVAVPALQNLSPKQYDSFSSILSLLIAADQKVSPFEWAMKQFLLHHVGSKFKAPLPPLQSNMSLESLTPQCRVLMSVVIHYGVVSDYWKEAWETAQRELKIRIDPTQWTGEWKLLENAISELAAIKPKDKQRLLQSCLQCILVDKQVPKEAVELLRIISTLLGCPIPPIQSN